MTRKQRHKRLSHLFTIDAHIPKLDVAGSSPVSRSIFSILTRISHTLQTLRLDVSISFLGLCGRFCLLSTDQAWPYHPPMLLKGCGWSFASY